ncbi:reverse transcriptase domain-containing protein [Tanacetum coccineum]
MTTSVEKRNRNKFCEFHGEVGHNTDECMHLKRQIEELIKSVKLPHVIKELKQGSGKDQPKAAKKGETSGKDKALTILMVQPWQKVARQRITRLRPEVKSQMVPATVPLVGFSGEIIWPMGQISLLVKIGDEEHFTSTWMNFMVVRSPSPYNGIIGRPRVRRIQAIPSTAHGMLKFPVPGGILTLRSNKRKNQSAIHPEYREQTIAIGSTLTEEGRKALCDLLRRNLDIFAWKPTDMTGVPRHLAEHRLNVREGCSQVNQKKRGQAPKRNKAIQEEVEKLVDVGIKKEVHYHSWLSNPVTKEELIVYLAAVREAVSAVLMTEREAKQMPVYFVSRALQDQPIKQVLSRPEVAGRLEKLSIELGEYDIHYRPITSVKGQILVDFIVEHPKDDPSDVPMFDATNNEDEYEALIAGLRITEQMGIKNLQANVDSRLVANQVNGSYIAKESGMVQYLEKVRALTSSFKKFLIKQVPRSENKRADALSKIASTSFAHLTKQVPVEELKEKSINKVEVLAVVEEEGNTWMTPIYNYLTEETLPTKKEKARAIRCKSRRYTVINEVLYKKSYLGPWLRCIGPLQANYILREIHEGSCNMYARTRSVVAKAIRTGYYWPTMHVDARKMIRECQDCQVHCPVLRNPQQKLTPIMSPWPFYKWGIDIARAFPEGPGKVKFLIVAIDYFTKWIKAKHVTTITETTRSKTGVKSYASIKHPQANSLVEKANKSLGGVKSRLDERSKDWDEEIPDVLWNTAP